MKRELAALGVTIQTDETEAKRSKTRGRKKQSPKSSTRNRRHPIITLDEPLGIDEDVQQRFTPIPTRNCVVCAESHEIPDFIALQRCTHEPETCATCFAQWLEIAVNNTIWDRIECPSEGCHVVVEYYEVYAYASKEVFARFETLSLRQALSSDPDFRWCMNPECRSGQIHTDSEHGNIFTCAECGFQICTIHDIAFHEGETCGQHDARLDRQGQDRHKEQKDREERKEEAEAGAETVKRISRPCPGPGCGCSIQKKGGCDHMTCSICGYEFCWLCNAPYGGDLGIFARGNDVHHHSCLHHSRNLPG